MQAGDYAAAHYSLPQRFQLSSFHDSYRGRSVCMNCMNQGSPGFQWLFGQSFLQGPCRDHWVVNQKTCDPAPSKGF